MKLRHAVMLVCFVCFSANTALATQPWSTMNDGWLYRNGNKFFAVGTWGIYGYSWSSGADTPAEQSTFNTQTADFNLIVGQSSRMESYMDDTNDLVFMTGTTAFSWWFYDGYYNLGNDDIGGFTLETSGGSLTDDEFSQSEMEDLNYASWAYSSDFNTFTDMIISNVESNMSGIDDYIWFLPDEFDTGRKGWCWYPYTLGRIYSRIKASDAYHAIYADFAAPRRGNRYFWDTVAYPDSTASSPDYTDYVYQAHYDGSPGGLSYVNYAKYPDNIKDTGEAYQYVANMYGINDYTAFLYDPENAGIAAACLHEGVMRNSNSKPPVWLWFNAFDLDTNELNVQCQVYTAIVYGCTGILFYSDGCSSTEWSNTTSLADELQDFEHFIAGTVIDSGGVLPGYSDIHYCIRQSTSDGENYLILTRTLSSGSTWVDADDIPNFDTDASGWWLYGYDVEIRNEDNDNIKKVAFDVTSVDEEQPGSFSVSVQPNPFNPVTTLTYNMPEQATVTLDIYNVAGQLIETLVDESQTAGTHTALFNGQDLPSGLYFYRISAGQYTDSGKMMLMK